MAKNKLPTLDELALSFEPHPDKASDGHDYLSIYDQFLTPLRSLPITLLEIGVWEGASIELWLKYFPRAYIIGVDFDLSRVGDRFKDNDRVTLYQASQSAAPFLESLPPVDIVIDDGSHLVNDQMTSFHHLWPKTQKLYIVEDLHTYFWPHSNPQGSEQWLIELTRDVLGRGDTHADKEPKHPTDILSMSFYQSLVILKKRG